MPARLGTACPPARPARDPPGILRAEDVDHYDRPGATIPFS
nr:hypothetical protein [Kibdelosporangium sp. MJ126-NF4]CTQ99355.1 hypothetical protein [Kibdelosporangium sp. MJ126-NF4]